MLFLAERALFRADCAPNVLYSVVCCSCSPHAHMASWDLMRVPVWQKMFRLGEELLIASRRIAFALTDTLANEVPPFTSHIQVPSL